MKRSKKQLLCVLLTLMLLVSGCGARAETGEPEQTTDAVALNEQTEATDATEVTVVTEPEVTEPEETVPPTTQPETVPPTEEPEETQPKKTESSNDNDDAEEVLVTMYATKKVNYRKGPGTGYDKAGSLSKGAAVQVVKGSKTDGWYKIVISGKYYYVSASYLSSTKPAEEEPEATESDSGSSNSSNNSNNTSGGEIIYTYPDGTTGTEPREGATYVDERGVTRVWHEVPESSMTEEEKENLDNGVTYCHHCGRQRGDGSNGTCLRWSSEGEYHCGCCGAAVKGGECHTCD